MLLSRTYRYHIIKLYYSKARRTGYILTSRLGPFTTQLNRREQISSHCHDGAIQTWRFSQTT